MPGGSGCTSSARIAMGIAAERSGALTELFESASHWAPSLIIFEVWTDFMGVKMRGRTGPESPCSIKRWLIGWGADARVLQPKELAKEIENECARLLRVAKKR